METNDLGEAEIKCGPQCTAAAGRCRARFSLSSAAVFRKLPFTASETAFILFFIFFTIHCITLHYVWQTLLSKATYSKCKLKVMEAWKR